MTNERIAEIKALCEAATPGIWDWKPLPYGECAIKAKGLYFQGHLTHEDANFIAAARQIIPELLEELEEAQGEANSFGKSLNESTELLRKIIGDCNHWKERAEKAESDCGK